MADEQDTTVAPVTEKTVTLTEAALNSMMAASRRSGVESATRKPEPVSQPVVTPVTAQSSDNGYQELASKVLAMESRNAFDRALLGRSVDARASDRLFRLHESERPTDLHAWLDSTIADFGFAKALTPQPNAPAAAPSSSVPIAFDISNATGLIGPAMLSPEQRANIKTVREVNEHNRRVMQQQSGAPPRRETPVSRK